MACCPRMGNWCRNICDSSYCTFLVSLFTTILSFADPVTDILTLVEFYREDHKTWFAVGLAFVVLPCVSFFVLMRGFRDESQAEIFLCGFNPFSSAWVRLKICWTYFKKCRRDDADDNTEDDQDLHKHSNVARLVEAVLESAPQFIIQLYAISVQQEPVKIIQMISVPVSFLSLAWAFTDVDPDSLDIFQVRNVKQKVVLFANYLFVLSSRLFATAFFVVTYKWWIISVLMIHSVSILIVDTCCLYRKLRDFKDWSWEILSESALSLFLHWLRDDMSPTIELSNIGRKEYFEQKARMLKLSNILFVIENCTMILLFYFGPFSNTWYSLPVTVCVCSFSVIGAVARVAIVVGFFRQLRKKWSQHKRMIAQPKYDSEPSEWTKGVLRFDMMAEYVSYV